MIAVSRRKHVCCGKRRMRSFPKRLDAVSAVKPLGVDILADSSRRKRRSARACASLPRGRPSLPCRVPESVRRDGECWDYVGSRPPLPCKGQPGLVIGGFRELGSFLDAGSRLVLDRIRLVSCFNSPCLPRMSFGLPHPLIERGVGLLLGTGHCFFSLLASHR